MGGRSYESGELRIEGGERSLCRVCEESYCEFVGGEGKCEGTSGKTSSKSCGEPLRSLWRSLWKDPGDGSWGRLWEPVKKVLSRGLWGLPGEPTDGLMPGLVRSK